MQSFRFSLFWLLTSIGIIAVYCAGFQAGTRIWLQVGFAVALLAVLTSILTAIWSTGSTRAFCVGFGIFGAVYLLLSLGPFAGNYTSTLLPSSIVTALIPAQTPRDANLTAYLDSRIVSNSSYIIHFGAALIFATIGGLISRFIYGRGRKQSA